MRKLFKNITIFAILIITFNVSPQSKGELDSREMAKDVIDKTDLRETTRNKNYIVFSNSDKRFIIIIDNNDSYREYYVNYMNANPKIIDVKEVEKSNSLLSRMFEKSIYRTDYVSLNSNFYNDGYKTSTGNVTYFAYHNVDGKVYGESRLTVVIDPNPIDREIYNYLSLRMLKFEFE